MIRSGLEMFTWSVGGVVASILMLALMPFSGAAEVAEYELDNGLRILVKPDNRAPVVTAQLWYMVGGSDEYSGLTGISHVLEHMMFKGTPSYPGDTFSRTMQFNGAEQNAFTSRDATVYHQTLAKDNLEVSFELEADRMENLEFSEEEYKKEIKVVMEERRWRVEDNPQSYTYEVARAVAFQTSPYRNPVIGTNQDLQGLELEQVRQWYKRWYSPNKALLVVVGDVESGEVYRLAKKHFANIKPAESAPRRQPREIEQQGSRRVEVKRPAKLPFLLMTFQVPSLAVAYNDKHLPDWEIYALSVLSDLLSGDGSSRLSKSLVRGSGVAASAWASYDLLARLDTVFSFAAIPAGDSTVAELEMAIMQEIERLQNELVAADELDKVKTKAVAESLYSQDSIYYQALLIGSMESIGLPHRLVDSYPQQIKAVTAEQVMQVARKYLTVDRRTVAWLNPQPIESGSATVPPASDRRH